MTTRWVETAALLALAWTVAVPVSGWFARARWTAREPVAALLAWQAIGLSGGFALLSAEISLALTTHRGPWHAALTELALRPGWAGVIGLILFGISVSWLLLVLVTSFVGATRKRREHRALLALLSQPSTAAGIRIDLIEAAAPAAYAVPGRTGHVVLTTGARSRLDDRCCAAVIAHERAHLRQRHTLLVQPFVAWQRSLPVLHAPIAARRRVEQLVEHVCDDAAVHATDTDSVRQALDAMLPGGAARDERLARLTAAHAPRLRAALLTGAATLVLLPPALLVLAG
jgi:Zn-dependent protease with chaperone function